MKLLIMTNTKLQSFSLLLLRWSVGLVLFVAGVGKVFGWFGGMGLQTTVHMFATNLGIPAPLAYLCAFTELIGGFLLMIGLFTRPAAFAVWINMLVATFVMLPHGFMGAGGGSAFPFSLMMGALAILLAGPMNYSIDALLSSSV